MILQHIKYQAEEWIQAMNCKINPKKWYLHDEISAIF